MQLYWFPVQMQQSLSIKCSPLGPLIPRSLHTQAGTAFYVLLIYSLASVSRKESIYENTDMLAVSTLWAKVTTSLSLIPFRKDMLESKLLQVVLK